MTFPAAILGLRTELDLGGTWTDISTYTWNNDTSPGVAITRGRPDEASQISPSQATLALNNADGRFSDLNPAGPYYGLIGRNTPLRVSVPEGASYLRLEGDQASYASCPDSSGISITGDTEIQVDVTLDNWRSEQMLAGKWYGSAQQYSWRLRIQEAGTLLFEWSNNGTTINSATSTTWVPVPPLHRQAIKVTLAVSTGTVTFWTAPAAADQAPLGPITSGWVQLGTAVVTGSTSVFDSEAALTAGGLNQFGWMANGSALSSVYALDAVRTSMWFNTSDAFIIGTDPTSDPRATGFLSGTPICKYTAYAQFLADCTGVNQTVGGHTFTARTINALFKWVMYDTEDWGDITVEPQEEVDDPWTYMADFATLAHAHGYLVMMTPARDLGNDATSVNPKNPGETVDQWFIRTNVAAAAANGDIFEVQAQADQGDLPQFQWFFNTAAAQAKAASAGIPVWCGLSTTYGNGPVMYECAQLVQGTASGFWLNIIADYADSAVFLELLAAGPLTPPHPSVAGKVHSLKLLSGIGGTVKASPDFTAATAGATSFADAESNTWTLAGTSEISNRDYRYHGEVAAWPKAWDPTGTAVWVSVTASGVLRRLSRNQRPLDSPMKRYWKHTAYTPAGYWPMEDGTRANRCGPAIGDQPLYTATGHPKRSADTSFPSSDALPQLNGAELTGRVDAYATSPQFAVRFLINVDSSITAQTAPILDITTTQTVWSLFYNTTGVDELGLSGPGGGCAVVISPGTPYMVSVEVTSNGDNVVPTLSVMTLGGAVSSASITPVSGNAGQVTGLTFGPSYDTSLPLFGNAGNTVIGHVAVQPVYPALTDAAGALNGFLGEAAGVRFERLCSEEGITFRGQGQLSVSAAMGYQTQDTLANLLQYCCDADLGIITEPRQCLGLGYRTVSSLYRQSPAAALTYTSAQLSAITPTEDDQFSVNDVTVTLNDGSSARVVAETGPLSVQPVPDGIGTYDSEVTIYLAWDNQAVNAAGWLVHLGTVNEPRYPALGLNMTRTQLSGIFYDLPAADLGDRYTVASEPVWEPADGISQLIAQVSEQLGGYVWAFSWAAVPEDPYKVALAGTSHADTDGCTLAANASSSATLLTADSDGNTLWTTAAADFPFDIDVAGERMTVTDISGPPGNFLTGDSAQFEASDGTWTGAGNGTPSHTTSQHHSGAGAMAVTSTAAGDMTVASCTAANITTQGLPCAAGDIIAAAAWFLAATTGRTCAVGAQFYTSGGSAISTLYASATGTDATSGWVKVAGTVTAPATAAYARLSLKVEATGAGSEVHYIDDAFIGDQTSGSTSQQAFTVTRSVNGVVKSQVAGAADALFFPPYVAY